MSKAGTAVPAFSCPAVFRLPGKEERRTSRRAVLLKQMRKNMGSEYDPESMEKAETCRRIHAIIISYPRG